MRGKKIFVLISIFLMLFLSIVMYNINNQQSEFQSLNSEEDYYMMAFEYGMDGKTSIADFFASPHCLERLKSLNLFLNEEFDFTELCFQPLYYIGYYNWDTKFVDSYQYIGEDAINRVVPSENAENQYVTDLKTVQLGFTCFNKFENQIYTGRNFKSSDFHIKSSDTPINVILGYDYLPYFKVNDEIELSLHQKNITFKIIGFYQPGTSFSYENSNIILDQCIVMPFYNIEYLPDNITDETYQKIYYLQKDAGYIRVPVNAKINDYRTIALEKLNQFSTKENLLVILPPSTYKISYRSK